MIDPRIALTVALLLIGGAVILFWPDRGLIWRLRHAFRASERVLAEDALKHLFDCEYKGRIANLQSVSGALAISGNRAAEILQDLESHELIEPTEGGVELIRIKSGQHVLVAKRSHPIVKRFADDRPRGWQNPKLYFGGVAVPAEGVGFELMQPGPTPPSAREPKC